MEDIKLGSNSGMLASAHKTSPRSKALALKGIPTKSKMSFLDTYNENSKCFKIPQELVAYCLKLLHDTMYQLNTSKQYFGGYIYYLE